jgi:DNA-binding MarR family transcriptional regulator
LTGPQCFILKQLHAEPRMTASVLAERMEVKPSAITVMVDRLVQNGFVERGSDPEDRRVTLLQLTEKGTVALDKLRKQYTEALKQLLAVLDKEDVEPFLRSFERIAEETGKLS